MTQPRILVITSCTGEKLHKPEHQLIQNDFCSKSQLQKRERSLQKFACPAWQMYTGAQHLRLMEGIHLLRQVCHKAIIDLKILSAGYGLVDENRQIVPYEVTFNGMKRSEIDEWSSQLRIHEAVEVAAQNYDLIFLLLGDSYLRAINFPIQTRRGQTVVALCSHKAQHQLQSLKAKTYILPLGNAEAKHYSYGLVGLKGFLFKQFANAVSLQKSLLKQIRSKPELFLTSLQPTQQLELLPVEEFQSKASKKNAVIQPPKASPRQPIALPDVPPAKNLAQGMRYFIPEWDDHVDPKYDFINDRLTENRDPYHDEYYAHEIYPTPNYDGILVSKTVLDKSFKKRLQLKEAGGIHQFLRYDGQIMGDCGAFSYITDEYPPYTTAEIIEYYDQHGFDLGVSVDHLIVGELAKDPKIRKKRYELTLSNAQEFLEQHRLGNYKFQPIGVAQGWDPESYATSVKKLLSMGYERIAIGGVARAQTREILEILKSVREHIQPNTHLHLFGVARINAIAAFRHLGVTSFDSASALRKAWLDPKENYHTLSGNSYTAVRIPQVNQSLGRVKKLIDAGVATRRQLKGRENKALQAIRAFERDEVSLESTLTALTSLDTLLATEVPGDKEPGKLLKQVQEHRERYRTLLETKPWKDCDCPVCSQLGVEVMIFRGNDRNRRRGFHNTYIFYKRFLEILAKEQRHSELAGDAEKNTANGSSPVLTRKRTARISKSTISESKELQLDGVL
jgi:Queuine tRNA-ribosyltransferase